MNYTAEDYSNDLTLLTKALGAFRRVWLDVPGNNPVFQSRGRLTPVESVLLSKTLKQRDLLDLNRMVQAYASTEAKEFNPLKAFRDGLALSLDATAAEMVMVIKLSHYYEALPNELKIKIAKTYDATDRRELTLFNLGALQKTDPTEIVRDGEFVGTLIRGSNTLSAIDLNSPIVQYLHSERFMQSVANLARYGEQFNNLGNEHLTMGDDEKIPFTIFTTLCAGINTASKFFTDHKAFMNGMASNQEMVKAASVRQDRLAELSDEIGPDYGHTAMRLNRDGNKLVIDMVSFPTDGPHCPAIRLTSVEENAHAKSFGLSNYEKMALLDIGDEVFASFDQIVTPWFDEHREELITEGRVRTMPISRVAIDELSGAAYRRRFEEAHRERGNLNNA